MSAAGYSARSTGARFARRAATALILGVASWSANALAVEGGADAVVLANGDRVTGAVYSDVPTDGVKIRLADGTIRFYPRAAVRRVEYGGSPAGPPAAALAPAPPAIASAPAPAPPPGVAEAAAATPTAPPTPTATLGLDPSMPPMPTHVRRENIRGLWLTGLIVDAALWGIRAAITGAVCSSDGSKCDGLDVGSAFVPVVGAFVELPHATDPYKAALVASGVFELSAFSLIVVGLAVHRDVTVVGNTPLYVVPTATRGGGGMALGGTF